MKVNSGNQGESKLKWWQLSMLGIASIIGTGFFLGSSIAISMAGPAVMLSFVLAAIGTYVVYEALAKMTVADPQKGSFRTYAKNAYGRWAGFTSGWVYWASEMLIMGSQMTALAIFSRFWLPDVPLWLFASGYAILGIIVIITGTKGFDRVEGLFAVLKIAAIVMFIILAVAALFGLLGEGNGETNVPKTLSGFFPGGVTGLWSSVIYGFYAFAGIEIMGLLAIRLKDKKEAPKSGKIMLFGLTLIYVVSIGLALTMVSWQAMTTDKSPFVLALNQYNLPYVPHVFNAVLIIAGFSTMVAALFAVIRILVTLAEDRDAPAFLSKKVKGRVALPAIGVTTLGAGISVLLALLMPGKIYEYLTTAAGLMLLYNWVFILGSFGRLLSLSTGEKIKRILGMVLILIAVGGTLVHDTSRPGLYVSLIFLVVIALVTLIMSRMWKKTEGEKPKSTVFDRLE
ncbi:amino acid permease [Desertibacillus haloalkaliphilus]|uniref:amino acid permease n=1 Tax=Desertibacillus haloalkaliphilus TaxID=1328930 RepID=UPI001C25D0C1|nr:amino acid permease [Desertibacillus haloalkaliphilus]MBU8905304.1 amino acid permease [Desertibacillus haloalkaliphilus]